VEQATPPSFALTTVSRDQTDETVVEDWWRQELMTSALPSQLLESGGFRQYLQAYLVIRTLGLNLVYLL